MSFVFSLDSDSDNISEVNKDKKSNESSGNETDTWTQSMPQAIKRGIRTSAAKMFSSE